ncbi:MAG: nitroreductase family protein [Desulfobulbus sp.]|nr:nitroreductase family protein [Desulfobulbus sp.]
MELFTIDQQSCIQDGLCAMVCPLGIVDWQKGQIPVASTDADTLCIRCGHCVTVCPTESFHHRDMAPALCPPVHPEWQLSQAQCEHFLRSRRSIRVYAKRAVGRDTLQRLIEMARYAPTGINSQGVRWLVVDNRPTLDHLTALVIDWMQWLEKEMPEMARTLHVDRAIRRWQQGIDGILRGAPALIIAHGESANRMAPTSCTIALSYLELAATGLGLGTCWAGYFNAAATAYPPLRQALALRDDQQCFGAMMVGYPQLHYQRLPTRNLPEITWMD